MHLNLHQRKKVQDKHFIQHLSGFRLRRNYSLGLLAWTPNVLLWPSCFFLNRLNDGNYRWVISHLNIHPNSTSKVYTKVLFLCFAASKDTVHFSVSEFDFILVYASYLLVVEQGNNSAKIFLNCYRNRSCVPWWTKCKTPYKMPSHSATTESGFLRAWSYWCSLDAF